MEFQNRWFLLINRPKGQVCSTFFFLLLVFIPVLSLGQTVTINANPNNTNICQYSNVTLTANASGGVAPYTYQWQASNNNGNMSCTNCLNPTVSPYETTTYTVTITDNNGSSATDNIVLNVAPAPVVTVANGSTLTPCTGLPATLTLVGNVGGALDSFLIDWGDGNSVFGTGANQNVSHNYAVGTFDIEYFMFDNGCTTIAQATFSNDTTPDNFFPWVGSGNGCVPWDTVYPMPFFTNTPGTVNINFNNGFDTTLTGPIFPASINYTFVDPVCDFGLNSFPITVTVTSVCGAQNAGGGGTFQALEPPTAMLSGSGSGIIGDTIVACLNGQVNFTNSSIDGCVAGQDQFTLDFGDGNDTTGFPALHSYSSTGFYQAILEATNTNGCGTSYDTIVVCVADIPIANFTLDSTNSCSPYHSQATNTSIWQCEVNYNWLVSGGVSFDGSSTNSSENPGFDVSGSGSIMLITSNACGADTLVQTVQMGALPSISLPGFDLCLGDSLMLTSSVASNASTYSWSFPGGSPATSNQAIPSPIGYAAAGTYTIALDAGNACDTVSASTTVTVHPLPVITAQSMPSFICLGDAATLMGSGGTSYEWFDGGGSSIGTGATISMMPVVSTTYTVTATDANQCEGSGAVTVNVIPAIPVTITPAYLSLCEDAGMVDLPQAQPTGGSWNGTGVVGDSVDINTTGTGTFPLIYTYTDTATGCSGSDTLQLYVNPLPQTTITTGPACKNLPTTFNAQGAGIVQWNWDFGNGSSVTTTTPNVTQVYVDTGFFNVSVQVISDSGCSNSFNTQVFVDSVPVAAFDTLPGCVNDTSLFWNTSTFGSPDSFYWDFGDGNFLSTTQDTVAHIYASPGTYTVVMTAFRTASGCSDAATIPVNIPPNTSPSFSASNFCFEDTVQFTNTTTGSVTTFLWDFGDGNTSTIWIPKHGYAAPGTYTVTLTTTNYLGCEDQFSLPVSIHPLPDPTFNAASVCVGEATQFQLASAAGTDSFFWDFGDMGNTSTQPEPSYVFSDSGTFTVTLLRTDSNGCEDADTNVITVHPRPIPGMNLLDTICYADPLALNDASIGANAWNWYIDNSLHTTIQNASYLYTNVPPATYDSFMGFNVKLVAVNAFGCADSVEQPVTILPKPVPDFSFDTVCALTPVTFTDSTLGSPNAWSWDFDDNSPFSTVQHPQHVFDSGGVYDVQLLATNAFGCSDSITQTVEVHSLPDAQFSPDTACFGIASGFLDASTGTNSIVAWDWTFGEGGNSSQDQNPLYTYQSVDTFSVSLTVTDVNGCIDTASASVFVVPFPTAAFLADTVCEGDSTVLLAAGQNAVYAPYDYAWTFGNFGSSNDSAVTAFVFPGWGQFDVSLTVENAFGCSDTVVEDITVLQSPQADFLTESTCLNDTTFFEDESLGFPQSWAWDFGDGNNGVLQDPEHLYGIPGNYVVSLVVTDSNGCSDSTVQSVDVWMLPVANGVGDTACFTVANEFTDFSNGFAAITSWLWDFGELGNTSNLQNPGYTYQDSGVFNVLLTVSDTNGCMDTAALLAHVLPDLVATFSFDTTCPGTPANFSVPAPPFGNPYVFRWDFGDGQMDTTTGSATHVYVNSGTYQVKLVVINSEGCKDSITHSVLVENPLTANFLLPLPLCAGDSLAFSSISTISSGMITGYDWTFSNGYTDNMASTMTQFLSNGSHSAKLIVETNEGCKDSLSQNFMIQEPPIAAFTFEPGCVGNNIAFQDSTANGSGNYLYGWDFDQNGLGSNVPNPVVSYGAAGTYSVELIIEDAVHGCLDSVTHDVEIYELPVADLSWTSACLGTPTDFTASITFTPLIDSIRWDFGDGSPTVLGNPVSHSFPSDSFYNVAMTVFGAYGCQTIVSRSVKINLGIIAGMELPDTICRYEPFYAEDLSQPPGSVDTSFWDFGDGLLHKLYGQQGPDWPFQFYNDPDQYLVKHWVKSSAGCISDTVSEWITVHDRPIPKLDIGNRCLGDTTWFTDLSTIGDGQITGWMWYIDGVLVSTEKAFSIRFDAARQYGIRLVVQSERSCEHDTSFMLQIHPDPTVYFLPKVDCDQVMFTDSTQLPVGQIDHYLWDFGDGSNSSVGPNVEHTYAEAGTYTVRLRSESAAGCASSRTEMVEVFKPYKPDFVFSKDTLCAEDFITVSDATTIQADQVVSSYWDFGDNTTEPGPLAQHAYERAGQYAVTYVIETASGCRDSLVQPLTVHPLPEPSFSVLRPDSSCIIELLNTSSPFGWNISQWSWVLDDTVFHDPEKLIHFFEQDNDQQVILEALSDVGCIGRDSQEISIDEPCEFTVYIPNAFTPNGDGVNDEFYPKFLFTHRVKNYHLLIWDRWGHPVFQTNDPNEAWNGKLNNEGEDIPIGTYALKINFTDALHKRQYSEYLTVTLVR